MNESTTPTLGGGPAAGERGQEMGLMDATLFGTVDKVQIAIDRLRNFEPKDAPYWLAFSGGKDSQCIYQLALESGVKFEAHYNATTVDPPELVRFIRAHYPGVKIDKPEQNMRQIVVDHLMPPTRLVRYCCEHLKEGGGAGRVVITGVRWAESNKRKGRGILELNAYTKGRVTLMNDNDAKRRMVEHCPIKSKHIVNPIVDWTTRDVWAFIRSRELGYCSLYDEGFKRLGCVACPQAGGKRQIADLERWPHFRAYYLRAFEEMRLNRIAKGLETEWTSAEEVMTWWVTKGTKARNPAQAVLFE